MAMTRDRTEMTPVPPKMLLPDRRRLATLAAQQKLPAIHGFRQWMEAGGLMSYGLNFTDLEAPTKFEFVINLRTAESTRSPHIAPGGAHGVKSLWRNIRWHENSA